MNIVYVLMTSRGGVPHYTAELANAISKYIEVTVIKPSETTADDVFSNKVKVINAFEPTTISFVDIYKRTAFSLRNFKGIASYKNIKRINEVRPDIVHFPGGIPAYTQIFPYLCNLDRKHPIVVTSHDVSSKKLILLPYRDVPSDVPFLNVTAMNIGNFLNLITPKIRIDKTIVHTQKNKETLVENGCFSEDIAVIPHGSFSFFRDYITELEEEENTILFFGNIVVSKAIDILVDSIPMIKAEIPNVKLIIAGDGVIPNRCWRIIKEYKSNFEVYNEFIPNEQVGEFFSRASIVVIPNRKQGGHSGSLTVAYSFSKPVVTTNVGEFPQLVEKAGCGLVVPPDDPKALADAIIKLLRDIKLRKKMAKNALKMAEELSWDNIAKMHIKVYEDILDE